MTDGGYSYTDFYRLRFSKRNYYEPKITFDREPIKAESFGQCIYEPKKRPRLDATACERIVFNDIETMWKTGNYSAEDKYFHPTKIYNVSEMQKYYLPNHTVPYNVDIPVFMPTDKIYLNNSRAAIDKQWNIFTQKTGITRKEQQKQKFISDDSDSIVATTAAPAAPVGGGGGGPLLVEMVVVLHLLPLFQVAVLVVPWLRLVYKNNNQQHPEQHKHNNNQQHNKRKHKRKQQQKQQKQQQKQQQQHKHQ
jgi:hypothetical protein